MGPGLPFGLEESSGDDADLFVPAFAAELPFFFALSEVGGASDLSSVTVAVDDGSGVELDSEDLSAASLSGGMIVGVGAGLERDLGVADFVTGALDGNLARRSDCR